MLSLLRRVAATLHRQRVRRIAVGELSALSDLALKDIGIDRGQIRSVVEEIVSFVGAGAFTSYFNYIAGVAIESPAVSSSRTGAMAPSQSLKLAA